MCSVAGTEYSTTLRASVAAAAEEHLPKYRNATLPASSNMSIGSRKRPRGVVADAAACNSVAPTATLNILRTTTF